MDIFVQWTNKIMANNLLLLRKLIYVQIIKIIVCFIMMKVQNRAKKLNLLSSFLCVYPSYPAHYLHLELSQQTDY